MALRLVVPDDSLTLRRVMRILKAHDIPDSGITVTRVEPDRLDVRVVYYTRDEGRLQFLDELSSVEGVRGASAKE